MSATTQTETSSSSRFVRTAHGGLMAPPVVLPIMYLLLVYYREIPFWDCFFSIAYPLYLCLANRFRFDSNERQIALRTSKGEDYPGKPEYTNFSKLELQPDTWFKKHMMFAASLGVLIPLVVQVLAPLPIAQAAAPHLYMLVCQIMMEMMVNGPEFHPLLQVLVPLGFSAYRMSSLKTWLLMAWQMSGYGSSAAAATTTTTTAWEMFHLVLAASNTIFWTCNTFIMLPLRVLPHCIDKELFPEPSNVSWYYMIPSVNNKDKARLD